MLSKPAYTEAAGPLWKNTADTNTAAHVIIIQVIPSALMEHQGWVGICGVQDVVTLYLLNQEELDHSLLHAV